MPCGWFLAHKRAGILLDGVFIDRYMIPKIAERDKALFLPRTVISS